MNWLAGSLAYDPPVTVLQHVKAMAEHGRTRASPQGLMVCTTCSAAAKKIAQFNTSAFIVVSGDNKHILLILSSPQSFPMIPTGLK
jgi:hypothetical protein